MAFYVLALLNHQIKIFICISNFALCTWINEKKCKCQKDKVIKSHRWVWSVSLLAYISCLSGLSSLVTSHHLNPGSFPCQLARLLNTLTLGHIQRVKAGSGYMMQPSQSHLYSSLQLYTIGKFSKHLQRCICLNLIWVSDAYTQREKADSSHTLFSERWKMCVNILWALTFRNYLPVKNSNWKEAKVNITPFFFKSWFWGLSHAVYTEI